MENTVNPPFDPEKYALDLHAILSTVTVSGHNNIHNMDVVLSGLQYLRTRLQEQKEEAKQDEI